MCFLDLLTNLIIIKLDKYIKNQKPFIYLLSFFVNLLTYLINFLPALRYPQGRNCTPDHGLGLSP